jgi:uncharacterized protein
MDSGPAGRSDDGLLPKVLQTLTTSVSQRPGATLWIVALITILSLAVTARFLSFKTNRADLIDPNTAFHQRWLNFIDRFGDDADIVVVVEAEEEPRVREMLDELGARLKAETELFERVLDRVEPGDLKRKALQYLSPSELEKVHTRLSAYGPILDGHWNRAGLESYCLRLADHIQQTGHQGTDEDRQAALSQARRLSLSLERFIEQGASMRSEQGRESFLSPWPEIVSPSAFPREGVFETRYQLTPSGRMGFLLAVPRDVSTDFSGQSQSLSRLRKIVEEVSSKNPDVRIGLTGIPVLESDEMQRSQSDMMTASMISFVCVGLIMLIGFRGFRHPFLALAMLGVGLAWALGYTTIAIGHLNILSVSFAAILIGLGIDFAIHYLARYLELRHQGDGLDSALVKTSQGVGTGIVTAAVTTSLAFLCATFTNFLGVAELGIIAGGGILLCGAATFLVLPSLVTLADRKVEPRRLPTPFQHNFLRRLTRNHPKTVMFGSLLLIVVVGAQGFSYENGHIWSRVQYDSNLLNLQAKGLESVDLQKRIFQEANGSLLYAVSMTESAQQARLVKEKFLALPSVSRVEELGSYLPAYPAEETNLLVQAIHSRLSKLSHLPREFPQLDPLSIGRALESLHTHLQQQESAVAREGAEALDRFLDRLELLPLEDQVQVLAGYQQTMLAALHHQFQVLASISDPAPISPHDFPAAVRERFVSDRGDWLVRVYPTHQIWDEAPLAEFVSEIRSIDPEATGTPLQNYEAARQIQKSYFNAAIYAMCVIGLVLLVDAVGVGVLAVSLSTPLAVVAFAVVTMHGSEGSLHPIWIVSLYVVVAMAVGAIFDFANVRNAFLAMLPAIAGGFLMFGILGILRIDLNPANLVVLPLILGIGVDDGVHVIHDYRLQRGRYETSPSTMNAITLTSLTSMTGFGSMMVAAHQGLVSLGVVLVVGVGSCLFVSLVLLPAVLTLTDPKETPFTSIGSGSAPGDEEEDAPHVVPLRPVA